jgi:hypothetical protein
VAAASSENPIEAENSQERGVNIEVPTVEFEEPTPVAPPTTQGQG